MKKLKYLVIVALFAMANTAQSQVSVNVNLGTPPVWAPANAVAVQYYYLPEIGVYYDVPAERYIYLRNGKWFRSAALPAQYRYYDLRHGRTVYLTDYRGNAPYTFYKTHKIKYGKPAGHSYAKKGNNGNHKGKSKGKGHGKKK
ncbi:hypothetical protein [Flavobacterium capsici]|uniref:PBCV-specific basic adaptor domain-containing protein n=1 Tax=Flavobacterium capsici TaxID=3075618 RepID=A0AA96EZA9_9FLAO|nr:MULTISPECIES: hypothetical protein [unclassified Flavobacterium]WNM18230.1 hypothetical protein RN608_09405 [Flavobacterium sp. PMR2A8]WNM22281.1 hypothetical protein RN605_02705 [Flavobacterium sp. PMTSA4]